MYSQFTVEVGTRGNQNFPINCRFVSGEHCTITYYPQTQSFMVVDHSSNGTWIIDDSQGMGNLQFRRISQANVPLGTWLNLGGTEPGNGHRMLVDHLLADADDFSAEFRHYNMKLAQYHDELEQLEEAQKQAQKRFNYLRFGACAVLIIITYALQQAIPAMQGGPWLMIASQISIMICSFFNPSKANEAKMLRKNVGKYFICPKCGRPLNEYAINSMQCPCGAK